MKSKVSIIAVFAFIFMISCAIQSCAGSGSSQKEDSSSKELAEEDDITKAILNNDYATAHKILLELYQDYSQKASKNNGYNAYLESDVTEAFGEFWGVANQLYVSEIQYLMPMNDMDANDKLLYSLRSLVPVGTKPHYDTAYSYYDSKGRLMDYANFVDSYNGLCDLILEVAITHGNKDMAKKILGLYKDEYVWENIDGNNAKFTKDTSNKEVAKERFSEAESNGEI